MKKLYFLFFLCTLSAMATAQSGTIKGSVSDTASNTSLTNANIILLNAKDSILYKYTRSNEQGNFQINNIDTGRYILLISYPNYADYTENFTIDAEAKEKDFGHVDLILKSELLKDVIVRSNAAAIRIKGDTTEFVADSFKTLPNATVEDLLKKLPGIQIDQNGTITAQGQTVNKVMVDGDEFFGDDPTLVTKNLKADMIDKVQLYDRQSKAAELSGIDDGQRDKTINLKLKEDRKHGYFGKLVAGAGKSDTDKNTFYDTQAMINAFRGKRKIAAFGILSNTGTTGLGWGDSDKYGGGFSYGGSSNSELDGWDGRYTGEGIPKVLSLGAHYDNKWNEEKHYINSNLRYGFIDVEGSNSSLTRYNYGNNTSQVTNSKGDFNRHNERTKGDAQYEWKPDSSFTIGLNASMEKFNGRNYNYNISETEDGQNGNKINKNENITDNTNKGGRAFTMASINKKFDKKGRSLNLMLQYNNTNNSTIGQYNASTEFFINNTQTIIDQRRESYNNNDYYDARLAYTEPITKFSSIRLAYKISHYTSDSHLKALTKDGNQQYTNLDTLFSYVNYNSEDRHIFTTGYNFNKNNTVLNISNDLALVNNNLEYRLIDTSFRRHFINLSPYINFRTTLKNKARIFMYYNGNTIQPSTTQMNPINNTADTLNFYVGNPNLKVAFNNNINLNYNKYSMMSDTYQGFYISYGNTISPIVTDITTNLQTGARTYRYYNSEKWNHNANLGFYMGSKIKKWDLGYNAGLNGSGNIYQTSINGQPQTTKVFTPSVNLRLNYTKEKLIDVSLTQSLSYRFSESTIETNVNNNGFIYNLNPGFRLMLPAKFEISSDLNYNWQQKTEAYNFDFNRTLWNASIAKKFFKKENLKLELSARDILNQNDGFSRTINDYMFTERNHTTIRRHFLLSLVWDFNKMGGAPAETAQ